MHCWLGCKFEKLRVLAILSAASLTQKTTAEAASNVYTNEQLVDFVLAAFWWSKQDSTALPFKYKV
jgi:hypothetical protein